MKTDKTPTFERRGKTIFLVFHGRLSPGSWSVVQDAHEGKSDKQDRLKSKSGGTRTREKGIRYPVFKINLTSLEEFITRICEL